MGTLWVGGLLCGHYGLPFLLTFCAQGHHKDPSSSEDQETIFWGLFHLPTPRLFSGCPASKRLWSPLARSSLSSARTRPSGKLKRADQCVALLGFGCLSHQGHVAHLHGNLEAGEEPKVTPATVSSGQAWERPANYTYLSRLWGLNLAPPQGSVGLIPFLSEESKKVPHNPSAYQLLSSTVIRTLLIAVYRTPSHSSTLLPSK